MNQLPAQEDEGAPWTARHAGIAAPLLMVAGAALRLTGLSNVEFKRDETKAVDLGMQLLEARPWATSAPWPDTGMLSSQGISNAPLFNHIMALLWAPTQDPALATGLVALLNTMALWPFYRWCRRVMPEDRAVFSLGVMALSPFAVIYSRKLWAQDLLFPCMVLLMWALLWLVKEDWWLGVWTGLVALLGISQLHQSGPLLCVVLPVAVAIHRRKESRAGRPNTPIAWPGAVQLALVGGAALLFAFFWLPYLGHLASLPTEVWAARSKENWPLPYLLWRLAGQVLSVDTVWSFFPHEELYWREMDGQWLSWLTRTVGIVVAAIAGVVLGAWGGIGWLLSPSRLPVVGLMWWGVALLFTVLRIPCYPHYVLILYPLPALLLAGAFWGAKEPFPKRMELGRWILLGALACQTWGTLAWFAGRGGAKGDFGVPLAVRRDQLRAVLAGGHPDGVDFGGHVATEDVAKTLECGAPGVEVAWLLQQAVGSKESVPVDVVLCEGWASTTDGKRFVWRVMKAR